MGWGLVGVRLAGAMAPPFADQSVKLGSVDSQAREARVCDCEALSKAEFEEAIDYGVLKRGNENVVESHHHWPGCLGAPVTCDAARATRRRPAFARQHVDAHKAAKRYGQPVQQRSACVAEDELGAKRGLGSQDVFLTLPAT